MDGFSTTRSQIKEVKSFSSKKNHYISVLKSAKQMADGRRPGIFHKKTKAMTTWRKRVSWEKTNDFLKIWALQGWQVALKVGILKSCRRTFFLEFHESCGQRDGCSCTRIRYVLAILLLLFLVACLEVWTGNWSQFCMTHHIVLLDPATPPMCCACRTSQAMRQLLWHISWYTLFWGDVQWISLQEKWCIYLYCTYISLIHMYIYIYARGGRFTQGSLSRILWMFKNCYFVVVKREFLKKSLST